MFAFNNEILKSLFPTIYKPKVAIELLDLRMPLDVQQVIVGL